MALFINTYVKKLAGIDYSMTSPCVTIHTGEDFRFSNCKIHYLTDKPKFTGSFGNITGTFFEKPEDQMKRFDKISDWAIDLIADCDHIMLEGYSMGSKGAVFNIAENTAFLKFKCMKKKLDLQTYPPTSLKKYACGKGNADKDMMYEAFEKETNVDLRKTLNYKGKNIGNPLSDVVDSFYLTKYMWSIS